MAESNSRESNATIVETYVVNIDVSDALTGLKAIQREAKRATAALRELESTINGVKAVTGE